MQEISKTQYYSHLNKGVPKEIEKYLSKLPVNKALVIGFHEWTSSSLPSGVIGHYGKVHNKKFTTSTDKLNARYLILRIQ